MFLSFGFVVSAFAQSKEGENGLILAIDKAGTSIYKGTLRAADVEWISIHENEKEYVVLPTTFHRFRQMTAEQVWKRDWIVNVEKNKCYITTKYKSNDDIRCIHSDAVHLKVTPLYDEIESQVPDALLSVVDVNAYSSPTNSPISPSSPSPDYALSTSSYPVSPISPDSSPTKVYPMTTAIKGILSV